MSCNEVYTQYNWFLLNKPKVKHKSVVCNLIKAPVNPQKLPIIEANPLLKTVNATTQCYLLPIHLNKRATLDKLTNTEKEPNMISISTKSVSTQTLTLAWPPLFEEVAKTIDFQFSSELSYKMKEDYNSMSVMQITRKYCVNILSGVFGEEPVTLVLCADGRCVLNIIFKRPVTFNIIKDGKPNFETIIDTFKVISGQNGHVFCPGINVAKVENANFTLPKSVLEIQYPFTRYQSTKCEVFYEDPKAPFRKSIKIQCTHCRYVAHSIAKSKKRKAIESPNRKYKRQRLTSNFPIKNLTPTSKTVRISRIRKNQSFFKEKFSQLEAALKLRTVKLDSASSTEMSDIVKVINDKFSSTLWSSPFLWYCRPKYFSLEFCTS